MLVFIDESGDPGMKGKAGTSEYFLVTAVVFPDHEEANRCEARIDALRTECFSRPGEFHFNSCSEAVRSRFLVETAKYRWSYFSFAFRKANLYGPGFQFKNSFYKYAVNLLFENLKPHLNSAIVIFDRCGNREFQRELKAYLSRRTQGEKGCPHPVKKIKANDSRSNNLLQLVDMVCGAVARSLRRDKSDRYLYRQIIRHREKSCRVWP